jgi:hypothetical protein
VPSSGLYQIEVDGNDSALHLHNAKLNNAGSSATLVVADLRPNEDGNIIYNFIQGDEYLIGVSTQFAAPSNFVLSITTLKNAKFIRPNNDYLFTALEITSTSGSSKTSNIAATVNRFEASLDNDNFADNNSMWYKFSTPSDGVYNFNTIGSSFDTVLRAYSNNGTFTNVVDDLKHIKTADDRDFDPTSSMNLRLKSGDIVYLSITSKNKTLGDAVFNWRHIDIPVASWVGDNFADALVLNTSGLTISNLGASNEANEPTHAGVTNDASVWMKFTPNNTNDYIFDTFGSGIDTVLAIYSGNTITALTKLANNDDSVDETSRVKVNLVAGNTYYLAIAGKNSSEGNVKVNYQTNKLNDNLSQILAITNNSGKIAADLTDASLEAGEKDYQEILASTQKADKVLNELNLDANSVDIDAMKVKLQNSYNEALSDLRSKKIDKSLWFNYTPTTSGKLSLKTINDNLDTAIFVFDKNMNVLAFNDNNDAKFSSRLALDVVGSNTYKIAVTAREAGKAILEYNLLAVAEQKVTNDKPRNAIALSIDINSTQSFGVTGINNYAKGNDNDVDKVAKIYANQSDKRLWWSFSATKTGNVVLDTVGSVFDSVIEVYQKAPNGKLFLITTNDNYQINSNAAKVGFIAKKGFDYVVSVDSLYNKDGKAVLNYSFIDSSTTLLENDLFTNAIKLVGNNLTLNIDNIFSSYQIGEPKNISSLHNPNIIWYQYQAPTNGKLSIAVDAVADEYGNKVIDPVLGVYQGESLDDIYLSKFNDDKVNGEVASKLSFVVNKDAKYYVAIATKRGIQGKLTLNLNFENIVVAAAQNSTIENSLVFANTMSATIAHVSADRSTGSSLVKGLGNSASSLWYKWISPNTGEYKFDLSADFIAEIEIYKGNDYENIVLINSGNNEVNINVDNGDNFYIRLTSSYENQGDIVLKTSRVGDKQTTDNILSGENVSSPSKVDKAGAYSWQHTAVRDGVISISLAVENDIFKLYDVNNTEINVLQNTDKNSDNVVINSFKKFNVVGGQTYTITLEATKAILGDNYIGLNYEKAPIEQVDDNKFKDFMGNVKSQITDILHTRDGNDNFDERIVKDYMLDYVNTMMSKTFTAEEIKVEIKITEQQESDIKAVRLIVIDKNRNKVLLASEIDPNNKDDSSNEQHMQLSTNEQEFKSLNFGSKTVDISISPEAFKERVDQAFISARKKTINDYPNRVVTPEFQTDLFEIDLSLFDGNNVELSSSNNGVINSVQVKMPINTSLLYGFLNDNTLNTASANVKLNEMLRSGKLVILSADNINELLTGKDVQTLTTSSDAVIDLEKSNVTFTTSHFSAFILHNTATNNLQSGSSGGGCVLIANPVNGKFDPTLYLMLVLSGLYFIQGFVRKNSNLLKAV